MADTTTTMFTGSLKATVKNVIYNGQTEMSGTTKASIYINVQGKTPVAHTGVVSSSAKTPSSLSFNQSLTLDLQSVSESTGVTIELMDHNNEILLASAKDTLSNVATLPGPSSITKAFELRNQGGQVMGKANISFDFKAKSKKKQNAALTTRQPSSVTASVSSSPVTRPKLLRIGFYYNTTKEMVAYGKQLKIVAPVINFSESSLNYILSKLHFKGVDNTTKADESLVPIIEAVDSGVDAQLTNVCTVLLKGQTLVLRTKDVTLTKATEVKDAAVSTASNAASKTVSTIGHAKDSTVNGISNATATTYKALSGAAVYALSYVPIIGKKVVAA